MTWRVYSLQSTLNNPALRLQWYLGLKHAIHIRHGARRKFKASDLA